MNTNKDKMCIRDRYYNLHLAFCGSSDKLLSLYLLIITEKESLTDKKYEDDIGAWQSFHSNKKSAANFHH